MFKDVFPYHHVFADRTATMSNGKKYRFIVYEAVVGHPEEPLGAAVFDEDLKLVLVDGLFAEEKNPVQITARVNALAEGSLSTLVATINKHPEARHQLSADGNVPW